MSVHFITVLYDLHVCFQIIHKKGLYSVTVQFFLIMTASV
jgi:hypothetical protein